MSGVRRTTAVRLLAGTVLASAAVAVAGLLGVGSAHAAGTAYYVDASAGNDANSGTSTSAAWRTLSKVNGTTFQPGDRILLHAGQAWTGQLAPRGSGSSGAPITIDSYGSGAKPRIDGAGQVADTVRLFNQEYWTIRDLEVTNAVPATSTPGANLKDLRGIHISGNNGQTLDGLVVDAVNVHDVTGEVNWISGSTSDNATGVHFQMGFDRAKKTGGIVFDTTVANIASPGSSPTILNNITVSNSVITNTSFAGIVIKQYTGDAPGATATGWGSRSSASDSKFRPHTNVTIRNNYVGQAGTAYGCDGIFVTDVRGGLVDHNVVQAAGTSGIESYLTDNLTIQYNEVYQTTRKAGGADYNGIDTDRGTTAQLVQYNYVHGNGDGILLCQFPFGNVVVRYNVIDHNSRYQIYLHSDPAANATVYNNTIYNDASSYLVYGYGTYLTSTYTLTNNILYSTRSGATISTSSTVRYQRNLYGGASLTVPSSDTSAVRADPRFVAAPITGPSGTASTGPQLASAYALKLGSGSPAVNAGVTISNNGGHDYAGTTLYNGAPDIGAFETPGPSSSPSASPSTRPSASASPSASPSRSSSPSGPPSASPSTSPSTSPSAPPSSSPSGPPGGGTGCTAAYAITNSWPGGYQATVTVTNESSATIDGWAVRWTLPSGQTISQVWNGTLTVSGSNVTVTNVSYNGTVPAGGNTTFGLIGNGSATPTPTVDCTTA